VATTSEVHWVIPGRILVENWKTVCPNIPFASHAPQMAPEELYHDVRDQEALGENAWTAMTAETTGLK